MQGQAGSRDARDWNLPITAKGAEPTALLQPLLLCARPQRFSRSCLPPMWGQKRGVPCSACPNPGTCVSNVAASSRESACSESSTKFLSYRVMGPSSLREAGRGRGASDPPGLGWGGGNPRLNIPWPRGSRHPPSQPRTALQHSVLTAPAHPAQCQHLGTVPPATMGMWSPCTAPHPSLRVDTRPCSGDAAAAGTEHHW